MSHVNRRGYASKFSVALSGLQGIPSGALTPILFDARVFDTLREFDITTTNTLIIDKTGYYFLYAKAEFSGLALGTIIGIQFLVNGGADTEIYKTCTNVTPDSVSVVSFRELTRGDLVIVRVYQNTGFPQNLRFGANSTIFQGFRVY